MESTKNRSQQRPARHLAAKKRRSHYAYYNWVWRNGERQEPIRAAARETADLIETCYHNPANGTKTAHTLTIDLDYDKAKPRWFADGKMDHQAILGHLRDEEPAIADAITEVVRSSGGKGLALAIAISPIDVCRPSSSRISQLACLVQSRIVRILNRYGMGADPAALGLARLMPNFFNTQKALFSDQGKRREVDRLGKPVIQSLLNATNKHPLLRSEVAYLWPHKTAEVKLAKLYEHLLDEGSIAYLTTSELVSLTGLSVVTAHKVLKSPPEWLQVAPRPSKFEPWELVLSPTAGYSARASELLSGKAKLKMEGRYVTQMPCEVEKGERNAWLTSIALLLKWADYGEALTLRMLKSMINHIPGHQTSTSCANVERLVRSIFANRPDYRRYVELPEWLREWRIEQDDEYTKNAKKGVTPLPAEAKGEAFIEAKFAKVGQDQRFVFRGCYYSLPSQWVGQSVLVCRYEGRIEVRTGRFFGDYLIAEYHFTGKSQLDPAHFCERDEQLERVRRMTQGLAFEHPGICDALFSPIERMTMPLMATRQLQRARRAIRKGNAAGLAVVRDWVSAGDMPSSLHARIVRIEKILKVAS